MISIVAKHGGYQFHYKVIFRRKIEFHLILLTVSLSHMGSASEIIGGFTSSIFKLRAQV